MKKVATRFTLSVCVDDLVKQQQQQQTNGSASNESICAVKPNQTNQSINQPARQPVNQIIKTNNTTATARLAKGFI